MSFIHLFIHSLWSVYTHSAYLPRYVSPIHKPVFGALESAESCCVHQCSEYVTIQFLSYFLPKPCLCADPCSRFIYNILEPSCMCLFVRTRLDRQLKLPPLGALPVGSNKLKHS
ncbi:hypothetical protein BJ170DRAFT_29238 [Xylariales sp. AK1849]|nr:hypothetical protein BJ170DRAFT_29238 [Xylariales sp. AK1849]